MHATWLTVLSLLHGWGPASKVPVAPNDPRAVALIDRAVTRMGGEAALRGVQGIRMEMLTQWQRTAFGSHPYADAPSFERNTDLRDYPSQSWRNTRMFSLLTPTANTVTVVRDTIAAFWQISPTAPAVIKPLNVAYVEERRELFAFAPERMLLLVKDGGGAKALTDTIISGLAHGRFTATLDGYPATFFMRKSDGLPAMVRFLADETNDFGLAPWGKMEVEFWYSGWGRIPPGVLLPRQRDVRRVGRPYKRMTLLAAVINPPAPADSFAIPDSTVKGYLATQRKPMWDASFDTVTTKIVAENFATFPPFIGTSGAVRVGGKWVLIETGQAAGAATLVQSWLAKTAPNEPIGAGIVTVPVTSNGGVTWFADHQTPLYVAPGGASMVRQILGTPRAATKSITVSTARWVKVGSDSLWLEPFDFPDVSGALAIYSPTHRWLYMTIIGSPVMQPEQDAMIAKLRARGLKIEWLGSARALRVAAPAAQ